MAKLEIPRSMNLVLKNKKEAFISLDACKKSVWILGCNNTLLTAIEAQTIGETLIKYSKYLTQPSKK